MAADPPYVSVVDVPGTVGQFLLNTSDNELIVELVQNELDAGSKHTRISALEDRLVCEGNGRPIDAAGWERLRFILAAGGAVEPKRGGIGAKNHGLRVGFRLGDTIMVQSAGLKTQLTARKGGEGGRFDPGAWDQVVEDPDAPVAGTRITIPYRTRPLSGHGIENLSLGVKDAEDAGLLISDAIACAVERFAGVTHPLHLPRYVLEFTCHDGRSTRFEFSTTKITRSHGGLRLFSRTAARADGDGEARAVVRERTLRFALSGLKRKDGVSWFFKGDRGIEAEVAWVVTASGVPVSTAGNLRYPIGYPVSSGELTGHGMYVSAPFVSNQARHGLAEGDDSNDLIKEQCNAAAAKVISTILVPAFGPRALELLRHGPSSAATWYLLDRIVSARALPAVGGSRKGGAIRRARVPLLVPWDSQETLKLLERIAPREWPRLHPEVPGFIIEELVRRQGAGACMVFTAQDAVDRMCGRPGSFPWKREVDRVREFSDPGRAAIYLQLLESVPGLARSGKGNIEKHALLPSSAGGTVAWSELWWAASAPPAIPGVKPPPIIHPLLKSLKLLRSGDLALDRFDMDGHLAALDWNNVAQNARQHYFAWLIGEARSLKWSTIRAIAQHPVFKSVDGRHYRLDELCDVKDAALRAALSGSIRAPTAAVRSFVRAQKSALRLRSAPSAEEASGWYVARKAELACQAQPLGDDSLSKLARVEATMDRLCRHSSAAVRTEMLTWQHATASRAGTVDDARHLHVASEPVKACKLADVDVAKGAFHDLYAMLGAHVQPSAAALARALASGSADQGIFYRRLSAFVKAADDPRFLALTPCVPTATALKAPRDVCIVGRMDYWGDWKTRVIPGNPERAAQLTAVGAVGPNLSEAASRDFFEWLSLQPQGTLKRHLPVIRRHWNDRNGPLLWWATSAAETGCIPAVSGGVLKLVSHDDVTAGRVLLPDVESICVQVGLADDRYAIVDESFAPLFAQLRRNSVRSLREALGAAIEVKVEGDLGPAGERYRDDLAILRAAASGKRLARELSRAGIDRDDLVTGAASVLATLTDARRATTIVAYYNLGERQYEAAARSGIDQNGVVWLAGDGQEMALFEALAERLFSSRHGELPYQLYKTVVTLRSAPVPLVLGPAPADAAVVALHEPSWHDVDEARDSAGHPRPTPNVVPGHVAPQAADPVVPRPAEFRAVDPADFEASGFDKPRLRPSTSSTPRQGSAAARRNTVLEESEKATLKKDHYGLHCQACLGIAHPAALTPRFTYLWHPDFRQEQVEAHHVAHLQSDGPLGAGNLVVLCAFHHGFLGDKLDRGSLVAALRDAPEASRQFPIDRDEKQKKKTIRGRVVTLAIDEYPYEAKLFFTRQHTRAWLDRNSPDNTT